MMRHRDPFFYCIAIPKNSSLTLDKYFRHAQYYKMFLLQRSLNERVPLSRSLGAWIKESQLF